MSAGALGMNLLHAAHARGYVGSWLTGWAAYSPAVAAAFGAGEGESITGYFFFGTPGEPLKERPRPEIGRASCRDRVCQYVSISVVGVSLKKKPHRSHKRHT